MSKLVVLEFNGDADKGFLLSLKIGHEGEFLLSKTTGGSLPPAADLFVQYKNWQSSYRRLEYSFRLKYRLFDSLKNPQKGKNNSLSEIDNYIQRQRQECSKEAEKFKGILNLWLDSLEFQPIGQRLKEELNPNEDIRILIQTSSNQIKRLPWSLWNFLKKYPKAEIALSAREAQRPILTKTSSAEIKILSIIGNSKEINVKKYQEDLLNNLPNAKITFLEEPQREQLNDQLWQQSWDILFFAGHSRTEGQRGRIDIHIDINQTDSFRVDEIKLALKKAIDGGLKLAIFNSCDGLGLISELETLNIPQMLVMGEPLPDLVAQKFLTNFLVEFAKGASLYHGVRIAREKLQALEEEFTCASWLPIIYQNPAVVPPTWDSLLSRKLLEKAYFSEENVEAENIVTAKMAVESEISSSKVKPVIDEENEYFLPFTENISERVKPKEIENPHSSSVEIPYIEFTELSSSQPPLDEISSLDFQDSKPSKLGKNNQKVGLISLGIASLAIAISSFLFSIQFLSKSSTSSQTKQAIATSSTPSQSKEISEVSVSSQSKAVSEFSEVKDVPSGTFNYGGSTAWATIRAQVDPEIQLALPEFNLRYVQHSERLPGSSTGIWMLINEQKSFAQSSRPLKESEYQEAKKQGFDLKEIPVAIDGIAIAVHPSLNISALTLAQIKDIYLGKITNWKQVGGPDLKIIPYSRPQGADGTVEFFVENFLKEQKFGEKVEFVNTTTEALRNVALNKGGIYFASASKIVEQCTVKPLAVGVTLQDAIAPYLEPLVNPEQCPALRNQLNRQAFQDGSYPLTRNLYVITKQNGKVEEQAGIAYAELLLSDRGQELIEKAGFVSIRQ